MRNTAGNLLLWTIGTLLECLELPLFAVLLHKEVSWYSRPLCVALLHLEIPQGSRFVLFVFQGILMNPGGWFLLGGGGKMSRNLRFE
jgi:hypothetical protein